MQQDIIFGIVMSTNITEEDFDAMKQYVTSFIHHTNMDTGGSKVGLFVCDSSIQDSSLINLGDTSSKQELISRVNAIPYKPLSESASLYSALHGFHAMFKTFSDRTNGTRSHIPDLALLFMTPDINMYIAKKEAQVLREEDIYLLITAVGFEEDDDEMLHELAFRPDNYVFKMDNFYTMLFESLFVFQEDECGKLMLLWTSGCRSIKVS